MWTFVYTCVIIFLCIRIPYETAHYTYGTHKLYAITKTFDSCMQGKGEMRTYWLVGEDPARRLARLRGQTMSSSAGMFSFERE